MAAAQRNSHVPEDTPGLLIGAWCTKTSCRRTCLLCSTDIWGAESPHLPTRIKSIASDGGDRIIFTRKDDIRSGPFTKKKTPGEKPGVAIRDVGKELVGLVERSLSRTAFVDPTSNTAKVNELLIFFESDNPLSFTQCISGRMRIPRMAAKTLCACRILIQAKDVHVPKSLTNPKRDK